MCIVNIVQAVSPVVPVAQAHHQTDGGKDWQRQGKDDVEINIKFPGSVDFRRFHQRRMDIGLKVIFVQKDIKSVKYQRREDQSEDGIFYVEHRRIHQVAGNNAAVKEHGKKYHKTQHLIGIFCVKILLMIGIVSE